MSKSDILKNDYRKIINVDVNFPIERGYKLCGEITHTTTTGITYTNVIYENCGRIVIAAIDADKTQRLCCANFFLDSDFGRFGIRFAGINVASAFADCGIDRSVVDDAIYYYRLLIMFSDANIYLRKSMVSNDFAVYANSRGITLTNDAELFDTLTDA